MQSTIDSSMEQEGVTRQGRVSQLGNGTAQNATGLSTMRTKTVCYVVCVRNGAIKSVQDLLKKKIKMLKESDEDVWWVCADCRKNDGEVSESDRSRLDAKVDKMMNMIISVMTRLAKLEERKPELTERDLDEWIEKKVDEALEEMQERENRRMNVVFVNVPESEADTQEGRKKEDLKKIATIVRSVSDVTKDGMTDPTRLGAKVIGKDKRPRMLRVTVRNEETKKNTTDQCTKTEHPRRGKYLRN